MFIQDDTWQDLLHEIAHLMHACQGKVDTNNVSNLCHEILYINSLDTDDRIIITMGEQLYRKGMSNADELDVFFGWCADNWGGKFNEWIIMKVRIAAKRTDVSDLPHYNRLMVKLKDSFGFL